MKTGGDYIDLLKELGGLLLKVDKPARYSGGEYGIIAKKNCALKTIIAFPDLYEIGMGNQAMRLIYNRMNSLPDVSCDRVFAPAPDFEKLLREKNIPLYGLDNGINPLRADMLMFTIGYELGLNGILTILDLSGIPLHCTDRKKKEKTHSRKEGDYENEYPIVIAGGPAVSNPHPFSPFIDAFWIGEAEEGFFDLIKELTVLKKRGESRAALFDRIASHQNIWVKGKEKTKRAIFHDFENNPIDVYPVPSMKTVHHHGTVEIMRGCPNGCRFCHAGFWYRPCRQKKKELIIEQAEKMAAEGGWQEISLSSLSTGDYTDIAELLEYLNLKFSDKYVSFQMPSLKIHGFALSLLEKISVIRKSGLTFAVETPLDFWQMSVNKEVSKGSVFAILKEAKKHGWKGAKFYFMIGLPVPSDIPESKTTEAPVNEEEEIVSFITDIGCRSRMRFNINIGIFIPKPHTPYQWVSQIDSETAEQKINFIRSKLKPLGHKVSASDSLVSQIEGLLSRGDERAGLLCEEAWHCGSRLDPWSEYINREKWQEIIGSNINYVNSVFKGKNEIPQWLCIDSCVTGDFLKRELEKSNKSIRTPSCRDKCSLCGVCEKKIKQCEASVTNNENSELRKTGYSEKNNAYKTETPLKNNCVNGENLKVNENIIKRDPSIYRVLFAFSKTESAVFHGHLSLIEIFSLSFRRANIPVKYTSGFNPLVKLEFASPLTTGISADSEIAAVDFLSEISTGDFIQNLNKKLPKGINIKTAECFHIKSGAKKHSLASLLWGSSYMDKDGNINFVNAKNEKVYRRQFLNNNSSLFYMKRHEVLARNILNSSTNEWTSYFDVYRCLYFNH